MVESEMAAHEVLKAALPSSSRSRSDPSAIGPACERRKNGDAGGRHGSAALGHQASDRRRRTFDAPDFVAVASPHHGRHGLGESAWLAGELAKLPAEQRRVRIPTITDPRGLDFDSYKRLKQTDAMADLEARAIAALEALGVLMTNTCINYQTVLPPVRGEHLAFGDTGVVIYSNSVMGARSNFEGGPSALSRADRSTRLRLSPRCIGRQKTFRSAHSRATWPTGRARRYRRQSPHRYWEVPVVSVSTQSEPTTTHLAPPGELRIVALFNMRA